MKKKIKYGLFVSLLVLVTGCTTNLKDKDGKLIVNPTTGQSLTENILSQVRSITTEPKAPSKWVLRVSAIRPQRTTSPERGKARLAR